MGGSDGSYKRSVLDTRGDLGVGGSDGSYKRAVIEIRGDLGVGGSDGSYKRSIEERVSDRAEQSENLSITSIRET